MGKDAYVYIMTNKLKSVLYIGVTNNLPKRVYEHKNKIYENSFTAKYNITYCIYFEEYNDFMTAINREKEIKKWNRKKKEDLINSLNPNWDEIVTEKGFIRNKILFKDDVQEFMKELLNKDKDIDSSSAPNFME